MSHQDEVIAKLEKYFHFACRVRGKRFALLIPYDEYRLTNEYKKKYFHEGCDSDPYVIVLLTTGCWSLFMGYRTLWGKSSFCEDMMSFPGGEEEFIDMWGQSIVITDPNYWL